jgi:hypothetical protein
MQNANAKTATQNSAKTVVTGECRGSYVNVFKPKLNDMSGKEEYGMALLIPKTDTATINALKKAAAVAAGEKWPTTKPANMRNPLRDGDVERPDDANYAGHYWINVKSQNPVGIVDRNLALLTSPSDFVSGDYCRVKVGAYAYDQKGNKGVAFGLNSIQKTRSGEPLGVVSRPENDFTRFVADDEDDNGSDAGGDDWLN